MISPAQKLIDRAKRLTMSGTLESSGVVGDYKRMAQMLEVALEALREAKYHREQYGKWDGAARAISEINKLASGEAGESGET